MPVHVELDVAFWQVSSGSIRPEASIEGVLRGRVRTEHATNIHRSPLGARGRRADLPAYAGFLNNSQTDQASRLVDELDLGIVAGPPLRGAGACRLRRRVLVALGVDVGVLVDEMERFRALRVVLEVRVDLEVGDLETARQDAVHC